MIICIHLDYYLTNILPGNCDGVMGLKHLPDGTLASVGWDGQLLIWNVNTVSLIRAIQPQNGAIQGMTLLPNSNIVTGSGGLVQIWSLTSANPLLLSISTDWYCFAFEVLSDKITLAVGSGWVGGDTCTGTCTDIKLFNSNNGTLIKSLIGHTDSVQCLKLLTDGTLASGSRDSTIRIWNVTRAAGTELIRTMLSEFGGCLSLELLSDGVSLACGAGQLAIWNVFTGSLIKTLGGSYSAIFGLKLIGTYFLALATDYSRVDIMDVRLSGSNALIQTLQGNTSWVTAVELLEDGSLASGSSANGCADLQIYRTS